MENSSVRDCLGALNHAIGELKEFAIDTLRTLVRTPSVTGNEQQAQGIVAHVYRELHLEVDSWNPIRTDLEKSPVFSDDGLPLGDRPVIVGTWRGNSGTPSIILNGHIDVVPPGDQNLWNDGPWSGEIKEGRLYGRGSCDMKGGLVSGILAVAALQRIGWRPRGSVILQSVIGEETGGAGTLSAILRGYHADAAIVLEPTRLQICPAGAGAASFRLHVKGLAAHGAMRQQGISAVEKFIPLFETIEKLETERHRNFQNPLFASTKLAAPISIGKVYGGDWPSTVPEKLTAEGRYGILPGENIESARVQFENAIHESAMRDPWLRENPPEVEWFEGQFEPAATPLDSPFISKLAHAHQLVTRAAPNIEGVPYGSDLRFFTNQAKMSAVLYGPGDVALAHSVNEFVPLEEVFLCAKTVALLISQWQHE